MVLHAIVPEACPAVPSQLLISLMKQVAGPRVATVAGRLDGAGLAWPVLS